MLEPNHPKLLTEKGVLLGRMGFETEGVEFLKRVPSSRPWNTDSQKALAYRELAIAFANLDQVPKAHESLQKAIALFPEDPDLINDLNYLKELT